MMPDRDQDQDAPDAGLFDGGSLPALSMEATPRTPTHPFARPEPQRYRTEHVLGWGGMGRVEAVTDQRLDREVAVKRAAPGPHADARLAQEAQITARLEHPGIVPVYDAGQDDAGRPWYAMRLIRGQTLGAAIHDGSTPQRRLIRHFLAACEAVGYAHHEGVIHRDLKPGNILIGAFGETQVVDWGLARLLGASAVPSLSAQVHTIEGSIIGTPAYMSPEQAAGRETDRRSDVWSLGATLFTLLSGQPPFAGAPDTVLRLIVTQPPPQLTDAELPAALVAIVRRAMQPDPAARYPSAQEMAADIERWLTGDRVQAHRYTSGELLVRFVVARRAAVVVAAVAAVALLLGGVRLVQERDRAVAAEQLAEAARAASDTSLVQALTAQALAAQFAGAQPEAEVLAAAALRLAPNDPLARGTLAAFSATEAPRLAEAFPLPACESADVSPDGSGYACHNGALLTFYDRTEGRFETRWSRRVGEGTVRFTHPERVVVYRTADSATLLDTTQGALITLSQDIGNAGRPVPSGPDEILWWNGSTSIIVTTTPTVPVRHWQRRNAAMARQPGGPILLVDVAGGIYAFHSEEDIRFLGQTSLIGEHQAAHLWVDGEHLVLAGLRGQAAVVELATGQPVLQVRGLSGNVIDARLSPDRSLLAIAGEHGNIEVFRIDTGARIAQLPGAGVWSMRFLADSRTLETYGADLRRWRLPARSTPRRWTADGGITAVSASRDGKLVASTGNGTVWLWDMLTGAVQETIEVSPQVIKAVDFAADGEQFVFHEALTNNLHFGSASSGALETMTVADLPALRRLCWSADLIIGTSYGLGPNIFDVRTGVYHDGLKQAVSMMDLDCAWDEQVAVMTASDGGVWRLDTSRPMKQRWLMAHSEAGQIAVDSRPQRRIAVADADEVFLLDADTGAVRATLPPPRQRIFDLTFSPDGTLLAGGLLDGSIMVWDTDAGTVLAQLKSHTQRVSSLTFTADGTGLLSASWDGDVRLWGIGVLSTPADALAGQIEERWGLSQEEALQRVAASP